MSSAEIIFLAVVVLAGIPAARLNVTAVGLVGAYALTQGLWYFTGWGHALLSHPQYRIAAWIILDMTVIAIIFIKYPAFDCWPYHNRREQFRAFWCERSHADRVVLVGFALAQFCYFGLTDEWLRWWALYWISLGQFIAAGMESFGEFKARSAKARSAPDAPSSGTVQFTAMVPAYGGGRYG